MSAVELLLDLGRVGIRLEADGEKLRYFPRSALTPDLLDRLKTHKAELVAMLRTNAKVPDLDRNDATAVWGAAVDRLHGDPLFPHGLLNAMRGASVRWGGEPATKMAEPNESGNAAEPVCRCGSTAWRDVPIHGGQSVRRDCRRCRKFLSFPVWYGKDTLQNEN
jgi:hypothetical protein